MQETDVYTTYADISALEALTGYSPSTPIGQGLDRFLDWFNGYTTEISLNLSFHEKNNYTN
jgi:nucleoside-diphosphate-sugar epimerase